MIRICKEESLPPAAGLRDPARRCARGTPAQKAMAQDAVEPLVVAVADDVRPVRRATASHSAQSMRWKIKRFSNDELRQKFVDMTVPQAECLGLDAARPRPALERGDAGTATSARSTGTSSGAVLRATGRATASASTARAARARGRRLGARGGRRRTPRKRAARSARPVRRMSVEPESDDRANWPLWEVFVRARNAASSHKHVGSLHAPDAEMALQQRPRRLHPAQRGRVASGWSPSTAITASSPDEKDALLRPGRATRSTGTRPSTRCPTRSSTCDRRTPAHEPRTMTPPTASTSCCASATTRWCSAQRLGEWVGTRAGARGGHRARQHRPRPDRARRAVALRYAGELEGAAATRTSSPTCATPPSSATCCWSSSRTATSPTTMVRQLPVRRLARSALARR